jgi:hypothetical protein
MIKEKCKILYIVLCSYIIDIVHKQKKIQIPFTYAEQ